MVDVLALLLCDRAERDAQSGKWTLEGIFDVVWAERFPAVHEAMDVYARLAAPAGSGVVQVSVVCRSPSGEEFPTPPLGVRPEPRGSAETVVRLEHLPLPEAGAYTVEIHVDGEAIGSTPLTVATQPSRADRLH